MSAPHLFIGNKNYSSWSMRPWLALRWAGIAFEETMIPLGSDGYGAGKIPAILAVSPTGRVPALRTSEGVIWDSLAICEWAAEQAPSLWPEDRFQRALARSASCEMHSGFAALRRDLSMNIRRRTTPKAWPADTQADIARVQALWAEHLQRSGGPFLFGRRSIADAMFAPVCTRFRTYGVEIAQSAQAYCDAIFADADFIDWERAAIAEPQTIPSTDAL